MKLSKALKEKNRLVGEINRIKIILARENSRDENSFSKIDRALVWEKLDQTVEKLIKIKAAIFAANVTIQEDICRLSEIKSRIEFLKTLNVAHGNVEYPSYNSEPIIKKLDAYYKQDDIDNLTDKLQLEIEKIQDRLDEYNAITEVSYDNK